ncbi:uncharacterized protein LOC124158052 [Ischnura elegans]|uniref:uncharacterized protein LOC124158052 n=1 Tax=Ischnura elegans TaxID=197161 RepID=UPI001ED8BC8F|nr:uncharacterized protein LOC124158052 [Ischnura elegans]
MKRRQIRKINFSPTKGRNCDERIHKCLIHTGKENTTKHQTTRLEPISEGVELFRPIEEIRGINGQDSKYDALEVAEVFQANTAIPTRKSYWNEILNEDSDNEEENFDARFASTPSSDYHIKLLEWQISPINDLSLNLQLNELSLKDENIVASQHSSCSAWCTVDQWQLHENITGSNEQTPDVCDKQEALKK